MKNKKMEKKGKTGRFGHIVMNISLDKSSTVKKRILRRK